MRTRVLAAVVWMHVLTTAAGAAPKPVQKTRLRFVNTEGLEADTLLRPSSGGSEEAGAEAEDELMTVLKEVISETEDHESPSRITEILTSRGYTEAAAVSHNVTRLIAESSALKKVFERLLTKKREARLAAEAAEAAGAGARPRTGRARKQKQRLAAQQDCDTTFQVRSVIIIIMLLIIIIIFSQTEIRPECTTVVEEVCRNVTVTRTRPDIKEKCTTRVRPQLDTCLSNQCSRVTLQIDQKCKPTKTEIPEKKCSPRYNKK